MDWNFRLIALLVFLLSGAWAHAAEPVSMRVTADQVARVAPSGEAAACATLPGDSHLSVSHATQGWYAFQSPETGGKLCWVPSTALEPVTTRSLALAVPLFIETGRVVVTFLRDLFTGRLFRKKTGLKLEPGTMLSVLEETADRLRVRTEQGQEGWIPRDATASVQQVARVPEFDQGVWAGHEAVKGNGDLFVEVWVQKADGSRVSNNGLLRLGDEYEIHARCSRDCYLRITCETPAAGAVCQYSPNQFPGFGISPRILAGQDAWGMILPPGVRFRVSEPVMSEDILRVEAVSAGHGKPFYFVSGTDKGDGCASAGPGASPQADGQMQGCGMRGGGFSYQGCGYRGGGFSATPQGQTNPIPELVTIVRIKTVR